MSRSFRILVGLAAGTLSLAVQAQTTTQLSQSNSSQARRSYFDGLLERPAANSARSYIPFTAEGYVGTSVGMADYHLNRCAPGFRCKDSDVGMKIYTGGQLFKIVGLELAYVNLGAAERSGGVTRSQGLNLSALVNLPISFVNSFAKVGTTYGFTRTSGIAPGFPTGSESGFGMSYGAGVQFDLGGSWGVRAEWDRFRFKYATGRDHVNLFSIGAVYRFSRSL